MSRLLQPRLIVEVISKPTAFQVCLLLRQNKQSDTLLYNVHSLTMKPPRSAYPLYNWSGSAPPSGSGLERYIKQKVLVEQNCRARKKKEALKSKVTRPCELFLHHQTTKPPQPLGHSLAVTSTFHLGSTQTRLPPLALRPLCSE